MKTLRKPKLSLKNFFFLVFFWITSKKMYYVESYLSDLNALLVGKKKY